MITLTSDQLQAMTKTEILAYWADEVELVVRACRIVTILGSEPIHYKKVCKSFTKDRMIEIILKQYRTIEKYSVKPEVTEEVTAEKTFSETLDKSPETGNDGNQETETPNTGENQMSNDTFATANTQMMLDLYTTEIYTTQEMSFSFLKAELKEYKALGHKLNVKLNGKHTPEYLEALQAEYDRLEFTVNGVLACELSSDVIGGESEGFGYGWMHKTCEINPQPIQDDTEASEVSKTENHPKTQSKRPSVAHSFSQMLKAARKSESYGFKISFNNRLKQAV